MNNTQVETLKGYLKSKGLKSTRQRDLILLEFFRKHQHLTIEDLLNRVREQDPTIGYATVYRTLKLLTEAGLAFKREFGGRALFEQFTEKHHDHLICLRCGRIIEFQNEEIEKLQQKVCRKNNFQMTHHKMELYGTCERCGHTQERG